MCKVAAVYAVCPVSDNDYDYGYGYQHSDVLFEYIDLFCYAQKLSFLSLIIAVFFLKFCFVTT